jgi:hypothetical protein
MGFIQLYGGASCGRVFGCPKIAQKKLFLHSHRRLYRRIHRGELRFSHGASESKRVAVFLAGYILYSLLNSVFHGDLCRLGVFSL